MRALFLTTSVTVVLALSGCSYDEAGTASVSSQVNEKSVPDYAAAVAATGRTEADIKLDESRKPAEILAFMGLQRGDAALDIFAGGGYYSEIMGAAVGTAGSVVAVNPPQFVSSDAAKAKWSGIATRQMGVTMVPSQLADFEPQANRFDFAMMHLIFHDLYWESEQFKMARMDPAVFLSKLYNSMKPGGIVAVIDHVGNQGDTRAIVEKTHRIAPATTQADFEKAGFILETQSNMFANPNDDLEKNVFDSSVRGKTNRFVMKFRKPT
ncbi:MAG: methyltransferase [Parasphingorhabdus sp.]|uniref:class I SAM-dependent methyltransferase n=1 Tax=Parasphingorhabdus sp. TaxID=2709688 RepID=UPI00329758F6